RTTMVADTARVAIKAANYPVALVMQPLELLLVIRPINVAILHLAQDVMRHIAAAGVDAPMQIDGDIAAAGLALEVPAALPADRPAFDEALDLLTKFQFVDGHAIIRHVLEDLARSLEKLLIS